MCDYAPSSPLTYSTFNSHKLSSLLAGSNLKTNSLLNIHRITLSKPSHICNSFQFRNKNVGFQFFSANFMQNRCETDRLKPRTCIKVIPERYEVFEEELGFEEKGNKGFEVETRSKDAELENDRLNSASKDEIRASEESVSSSLDFLELKSDLEEEKKSSGSLEDEELVQVEGSKEADSKSEEIDQFVGKMGLRKGRQMIKRSNVLAKQVISIQSALSLGFISQLWVDTCSWMVLVVEVRPSMLSGEMERLLLEDVCQVGDFVLVEDESVLENDIKMVGLDTLVGYNVVTPSRRNIGKVRGYTFNINSGAVELLELDSFGISIVPSSLVSTYALFVEEVVDVESDTVVVHETAVSRVQRLSKGFWDSPNIGTSNEELEEHPNFERRPIRSSLRQSNRKFKSKMRETEDDWELPMDYL